MINRRPIAILEGLRRTFRRAAVASPSPTAGAVPEVFAIGDDGQPLADTAQIMPFPGVWQSLPPGCSIVLISDEGQDPVMVAGAATPAALKAVQTLVNSGLPPALPGPLPPGSVVICESLTGLSGIAICPAGVGLFGPTFSINGILSTTPPPWQPLG